MASLSSERHGATEHALPENPNPRGSEQEVAGWIAGDADEEVKEWSVAEKNAEEDGPMPGGVVRTSSEGSGVRDAIRLFDAMRRSPEWCEKTASPIVRWCDPRPERA